MFSVTQHYNYFWIHTPGKFNKSEAINGPILYTAGPEITQGVWGFSLGTFSK